MTGAGPTGVRCRVGRRGARLRASPARSPPHKCLDDVDAAGRRARVRVVSRASAPEPRRPGARPTSRRRVPMKLTVNGVDARGREPAAHAAPAVLREELADHEPEGRLPAGRLRHLHRARRRRAAALLPRPARRRRRRGDRHRRGARRRPTTWARSRRRSTTHYAAQCGFCTSGMMMAAEALLRREPGRRRREDIQQALARPRLPLHRLREDHRRGRGGRARRASPTTGEGAPA